MHIICHIPVMFLILAYFVKVTVCCNQTTVHLAKHLYTVSLNLVYGATQMCFKISILVWQNV